MDNEGEDPFLCKARLLFFPSLLNFQKKRERERLKEESNLRTRFGFIGVREVEDPTVLIDFGFLFGCAGH